MTCETELYCKKPIKTCVNTLNWLKSIGVLQKQGSQHQVLPDISIIDLLNILVRMTSHLQGHPGPLALKLLV